MASPAFEPGRLGPITIRNRVIKAATFEGAAPRGEVSDQLIDFHRKVAAGGVGMTTVAYLAVSPEGRTDRHCVLLGPDSIPGLRRLTDAIHAEGAMASAQIGHAGPVANPKSNRVPSLAPSRHIGMTGSVAKEISESDITRVTSDYDKGAAAAVDAGFDALEIHLGHNYLLSAFLSPKLNKRKDGWGGSLINRARFARQVVEAVRRSAGDQVAVTAKINMADGVPGGLWLDESLEFARLLEADGHLDALELTGGSSLSNPMYLFRGEAPLKEFGATLPGPVRAGFKLVGSHFMPSYPFEEAYFLSYARQFRDALSMPLILLGGINRLDTIENALSLGFQFVAMGRALLREPDLIAKMEKGASSESLCVHCNKCMPTIYSGTRCVLVPSEP
ncbi:MAG TPA: NADH:flavin oxidoreductase [Acidimicrobiales bacterium]|jgi:2,4-dienoyl-CoA reductase-like NADH-dependent reductase (Old Yellow Enzyme family)|nr:NADH:flavin oxidoreductase [Acidimicrobiales bacterium]